MLVVFKKSRYFSRIGVYCLYQVLTNSVFTRFNFMSFMADHKKKKKYTVSVLKVMKKYIF